jgi:hypothetical protein
MKQVAVQFSSVVEMIDFVHETTASPCEVNEENVTLTCNLSEADLDLAVNAYHATVVTDYS